MKTWVEKYRPQKFSEIKGQDLAIDRVQKFVSEFKKGKKVLLLHGPPGIGKTTMVHAIARETNSEIFELNASDLRNKGKLQEVLKPSIQQKSLFNKNKIILVDEVDGISASDRGGLPELLTLISSSTFPMIITANDAWKRNLSSLRKKCELIELKDISQSIMVDIMFDILRKENLFVNANIVKSLALRAKGDLRAAINDLHTVSRMRDPSELTFDERDKAKGIFNALQKIFKEKPTKETLELFNSVNMSMDEIILWMEANIPTEYSGEELARAYELLAKVDIFRGRIYRNQYWRFMVYENAFLSFGISAAKKQKTEGFSKYKKPTRILKIWMNNQRTAKKKSIAYKYSEKVHVGGKRAMSEFPVIKQIINSNPEIAKELRLNEEELVYLRE